LQTRTLIRVRYCVSHFSRANDKKTTRGKRLFNNAANIDAMELAAEEEANLNI
jgi:hypothetical protein